MTVCIVGLDFMMIQGCFSTGFKWYEGDHDSTFSISNQVRFIQRHDSTDWEYKPMSTKHKLWIQLMPTIFANVIEKYRDSFVYVPASLPFQYQIKSDIEKVNPRSFYVIFVSQLLRRLSVRHSTPNWITHNVTNTHFPVTLRHIPSFSSLIIFYFRGFVLI